VVVDPLWSMEVTVEVIVFTIGICDVSVHSMHVVVLNS
jgi:hypothetical protein